jgi:lactate dehydrogenase-like 2-hydroxyacid dehydrogenase
MPNKTHLLSMGEMMPLAEKALRQFFEVHSTNEHSVGEIVVGYGAQIRAVATRGRERVDATLIRDLPLLETIASFAVGYDSIDVEAARERGIIVTNTPDVLNDEVADYTVGLLLATLRKIPQGDRFVRLGKWTREQFRLTPSLRDRTIGFAGMGRIARATAHRLKAFGIPMAYCCRTPRTDLDFKFYPKFRDLAANVDVLIVLLPGGTATDKVIDADVLAALGSEGILINVARGSVVDQDAVIEALKNGVIAGAGLDVFADEPRVPAALLELENVVLMPHAASGTARTRGLMIDLAVQNLQSWFAGRGPITPVPETPWSPSRSGQGHSE